MLILTVRVSRFARSLIGVLAQLVERLNGIEEVRGSNPLGSTRKSLRSPFHSLPRILTAPVLAPT